MMKTIPFSFLLLLLVGLSPTRVRAEPRNAHRDSCVNHLRMLDGATDQAAIELGLSTGDKIAAATISEYIRGGVASLKCPAGGRYTFGTVGGEPRCSIHGTLSDPNARGNPAGARELWGREAATETEVAVDRLLERMSREQAQFDPIVLKESNADAMRALAHRFFPQAAGHQEGSLSEPEVEKLVSRLGSDDFQEREHASQQLTQASTPFRAGVKQAARSADPEVRQRAGAILASWEAREKAWVDIDFAQYEDALRIILKNEDARRVLTRQAELARTAGPVNDGQQLLINLCRPETSQTEAGD